MNQENLTELLAAIDRFHRRWRQVQFLRGLARLLMSIVILASLFSLLDYHTDLPLYGRYILSGVFYAGLTLAAAYFLMLPRLSRLSSTDIALMVEQRHPELSEILATTITLTSGDTTHLSHEMIEQVLHDCRHRVCSLNPGKTFPLTVQMFSIELVIMALFCMAMSIPILRLPELMLRVSVPSEYQAGIGAFHLRFNNPKTHIITEGVSTTFEVSTDNPGLKSVNLYFRFPDGRLEQEQLTRLDANEPFTFERDGLYDSVEYWAKAGKVSTGIKSMAVRKRPKIDSFFIRHYPPPHTELPPIEVTTTSGDLKALANTTIEITITASKPLSTMSFNFNDQPIAVDLSNDRRQGTCRFLVDRSGDYTVSMQDARGLGNPSGMRYSVTMLPDSAPEVTVSEPNPEIFIEALGDVQLLWNARDDFGIARQEIRCQILGGATYTFPIPPDARRYGLELTQMSLNIGDELDITVHAFDAIRQEGVSQLRHATVLSRANLINANKFRALLTVMSTDLTEAQSRLEEIESSIQEVVLGQSTNIKENADLSHHLIMLEHRVKRFDRQLIRIISHFPQLKDTAFFPFCHQIFQEMEKVLGTQLIIGRYHNTQSIDVVKKGHLECQGVIMSCIQAVSLLRSYANRWVIDSIGQTTLAVLETNTVPGNGSQDLNVFYNAKVNVFRAFLPGKELKDLEFKKDTTTITAKLIKAKLKSFLDKNSQSIRNYEPLHAQVSALNRFPGNAFVHIQERINSPPGKKRLSPWLISQRFKAFLTAPKKLSAMKTSDRALIIALLDHAITHQAPKHIPLAIQAWWKMELYYSSILMRKYSSDFHQDIRNLLDSGTLKGSAPLSSLRAKTPTISMRIQDDIQFLTSLPSSPLTGSRNRGRIQSITQGFNSMQAQLRAPRRKKQQDTVQTLVAHAAEASEFFETLNRADLRWRNLMIKAVKKQLPATSEGLFKTAENLELFSLEFTEFEAHSPSKLNTIIQDLNTFAEDLESSVIKDSIQKGGSISEAELKLALAYTLYNSVSQDLLPLANQLATPGMAPGDQQEIPYERIGPALFTASEDIKRLAQLLSEDEALSYGLRSISQARELKKRSRKTAFDVLPETLIADLAFTEYISSLNRRLHTQLEQLPDTQHPPTPVHLDGDAFRQMSRNTLETLQIANPGSVRSVIREYTLQALRGFRELRSGLTGTPTNTELPGLSAKARFAILNLNLAEDVSGLLLMEPPVNTQQLQTTISTNLDDESNLTPARKKELVAAVDDIIITVKGMADRILFKPNQPFNEPNTTTYVLPATIRNSMLSKSLTLRYKMMALISQEASLKNLVKDYTTALAANRKQLLKLKKESDEQKPRHHLITVLLERPENTPPNKLLSMIDVFAETTRLSKPDHAKLKKVIPRRLLDLEQAVNEQKAMRNKMTAEVKKLSKTIRDLLSPFYTRNDASFCIGLMNHFQDSLELKDYDLASQNLTALTESISEKVPPKLKIPRASVAGDIHATDDILAILPNNPFAVQAIIESSQDNRLPNAIRTTTAQLISQGSYHNAGMMLPSDITEILYQAQETETLIPNDAMPAGFKGEQINYSSHQNLLPPKHFVCLSQLFLMGNHAAIKHYLNGDQPSAFQSLKRFAATLPTENSVICKNLTEELTRLGLYGQEFDDVSELPPEAAAVANSLLVLPIADYVFNLEELMVAYLENHRALSYLFSARYREAANAVYGLLLLMPDYQGDKLEQSLIAIVDLDAALYPSENHLVRKGLRLLNNQVPHVVDAVAAGDLEKAGQLAYNEGFTTAAELFHTARATLKSTMAPWETQAYKQLMFAAENTSDEQTKNALQRGIDYVATHQPAKAQDLLSGLLSNSTEQYKAVQTLDSRLKGYKKKKAAIKAGTAFARTGNIPMAIQILKDIPAAADAVSTLKTAYTHFEAGINESLRAGSRDISFGAQRSLTAAFNSAIKYDLVGAFAGVKRAGTVGETAAESFSSALSLSMSAVSSLEAINERHTHSMLITDDLRRDLLMGVSEGPEQNRLSALINDQNHDALISVIRTNNRGIFSAHEALDSLSTPTSKFNSPDLNNLATPPPQKVKYVLRALTSLQDARLLSSNKEAKDALQQSVANLDKALTLMVDNNLQSTKRVQELRSKRLLPSANDHMSAGQRAWLSRLETDAYNDFSGKRMSLGTSFLRGRKQNYSSYYKEANRHYLNWLSKQNTIPDDEPED